VFKVFLLASFLHFSKLIFLNFPSFCSVPSFFLFPSPSSFFSPPSPQKSSLIQNLSISEILQFVSRGTKDNNYQPLMREEKLKDYIRIKPKLAPIQEVRPPSLTVPVLFGCLTSLSFLSVLLSLSLISPFSSFPSLFPFPCFLLPSLCFLLPSLFSLSPLSRLSSSFLLLFFSPLPQKLLKDYQIRPPIDEIIRLFDDDGAVIDAKYQRFTLPYRIELARLHVAECKQNNKNKNISHFYLTPKELDWLMKHAQSKEELKDVMENIAAMEVDQEQIEELWEENLNQRKVIASSSSSSETERTQQQQHKPSDFSRQGTIIPEDERIDQFLLNRNASMLPITTTTTTTHDSTNNNNSNSDYSYQQLAPQHQLSSNDLLHDAPTTTTASSSSVQRSDTQTSLYQHESTHEFQQIVLDDERAASSHSSASASSDSDSSISQL
jgi:hypothetical protein